MSLSPFPPHIVKNLLQKITFQSGNEPRTSRLFRILFYFCVEFINAVKCRFIKNNFLNMSFFK